MKNIATLFAFICLLFVSQSAYAVNTATAFNGETVESIATEDGSFLSKKATKKQARLEKRIAKMQKRAAAQDIDFSDDTNKWKNFWLLGWGGGLLLTILGLVLALGTGGLGLVLSLVGGLAITFGTVSLIIWLVKKFA